MAGMARFAVLALLVVAALVAVVWALVALARAVLERPDDQFGPPEERIPDGP